MGASHACLQALIAAVGACDQVALRPREQIDHEADEVQEEDQQHPENSAVHSTRLGIAGYPYKHGNADCQNGDGNEDECAAAATASQTTDGVGEAVLRKTGSRRKKRKNWKQSDPRLHSLPAFLRERLICAQSYRKRFAKSIGEPRRLEALEDAGRAHASANAHGHQSVARLPAFHLLEECRSQFSAGAAERMAESDRATVDVD